jgi:hypothetical protein
MSHAEKLSPARRRTAPPSIQRPSRPRLIHELAGHQYAGLAVTHPSAGVIAQPGPPPRRKFDRGALLLAILVVPRHSEGHAVAGGRSEILPLARWLTSRRTCSRNGQRPRFGTARRVSHFAPRARRCVAQRFGGSIRCRRRLRGRSQLTTEALGAEAWPTRMTEVVWPGPTDSAPRRRVSEQVARHRLPRRVRPERRIARADQA